MDHFGVFWPYDRQKLFSHLTVFSSCTFALITVGVIRSRISTQDVLLTVTLPLTPLPVELIKQALRIWMTR